MFFCHCSLCWQRSFISIWLWCGFWLSVGLVSLVSRVPSHVISFSPSLVHLCLPASYASFSLSCCFAGMHASTSLQGSFLWVFPLPFMWETLLLRKVSSQSLVLQILPFGWMQLWLQFEPPCSWLLCWYTWRLFNARSPKTRWECCLYLFLQSAWHNFWQYKPWHATYRSIHWCPDNLLLILHVEHNLWICLWEADSCISICLYIHMCTHTHMYIRIHICMCTHIYIHMYI